jgi:AraC family transcriptional regulator, melibiose operon regulatory protein
MDELTILSDQSEILHYDDPAFPLYLRRNTLSLYPFKRVLCHWHQELEFFFVEKGNPLYFVNGQIITLHEGEGIFINAKTLHYGFSGNGEDSTYLVLVFKPSLLASCPAISERFLDEVGDPLLPYFHFSLEQAKPLYGEMSRLYELTSQKPAGYPLELLSGLYHFYALFLSYLPSQKDLPSFSGDGKMMLVKKMLSYLYCHYGEKISVADVASSAGVSESYALHLFKESLHSSLMDYLLSYRIEQASQRLLSSDEGIAQIALEVGFESPAYFSECFKKIKGYTPRQYRHSFLAKAD